MPTTLDGAVSSSRDNKSIITGEYEPSQEALYEAATLLAKAEQMMHIGSWQLDITTERVIWSKELFRIFGLQPRPEGLSIEEYRSFIHPEDRDIISKMMAKLFSSGKIDDSVSMDYRIILNDGSVRMLHSERVVKEVTEDGKPKIIVGIEQDVTERTQYEEVLRESEERFRQLALHSPDTIYLLDTVSNKIEFLNREFLGYSREELECQDTILHALHPDDRILVQAYWQMALQGDPGCEKPIEYRIQSKKGNWEWIQSRVTTLRPSIKGKATQLLVNLTVITGRKEMQQQLEEYAKNLELLIEERTKQLRNTERLAAIGQTAGMVGHDLRNPLQSIIGEVYLAKSELEQLPDNEQKSNLQESIEAIAEQAIYMDKIVSDLQAFVKPVEVHKQIIKLKPLISARLAEIGIPENVKTHVHIEDEWLEVKADPQLLKRVLINLLTNAVQAMPNGGKLTVRAQTNNRGQVQIVVEDTGTGIPDEVKPKIFTPLFTTKAKGQGFGLAVCKRVIEAQGGTISFESEAGKGAKFILSLPSGQ